MTPDFLAVGHVSSDRVNGRMQLGGSVLYAAQVARTWGRSSAIWTVAPADFPFPEGIQVIRQDSDVATTFHLDYDEKSGKRSERCDPVGPPINVSSLPQLWAETSIVLVCPIFHELGPDVLSQFPRSFLGLTPQGWFRHLGEAGKITRGKSRWSQLPRKVELIVVSVDDIREDSGSLEWLRRSAQVLVVTHGKEGQTVYCEGGEKELLPPRIGREIDPTGAGDTFATAMLIGLFEKMDPYDAAQFGSAAASFVVEQPGVSGLPSKQEIRKHCR